MKALLRFARAIVESVLSDLMRQNNIVETLVRKPMEMMIQQVVNGKWIGTGADAFVQDVTDALVPSSNQISQHITTTHGNIVRASEIMDRADQQVRSKVNGLSNVFAQIANGL